MLNTDVQTAAESVTFKLSYLDVLKFCSDAIGAPRPRRAILSYDVSFTYCYRNGVFAEKLWPWTPTRADELTTETTLHVGQVLSRVCGGYAARAAVSVAAALPLAQSGDNSSRRFEPLYRLDSGAGTSRFQHPV
jgi:hypothetical protein